MTGLKKDNKPHSWITGLRFAPPGMTTEKNRIRKNCYSLRDSLQDEEI